jgi:hypothetical protein
MKAHHRAKQGGINMNTMSELSGISRQHLNTIFNTDSLRFDALLIKCMTIKFIGELESISRDLSAQVVKKLNNSLKGRGE